MLGKLVLHKPSGTTTANLTVTHNVVSTAQVGSFTDAETVTPANFTARVSWGDGTSSVATVQMTGSAPRTFTVNASHTYANAGTYKARVYVSEPGIKYSWSKGFGVTVN